MAITVTCSALYVYYLLNSMNCANIEYLTAFCIKILCHMEKQEKLWSHIKFSRFTSKYSDTASVGYKPCYDDDGTEFFVVKGFKTIACKELVSYTQETQTSVDVLIKRGEPLTLHVRSRPHNKTASERLFDSVTLGEKIDQFIRLYPATANKYGPSISQIKHTLSNVVPCSDKKILGKSVLLGVF